MKKLTLSAVNVSILKTTIDHLPIENAEGSRKLFRASDLLNKQNSAYENAKIEYTKKVDKAKRPIEVESAKAVIAQDDKANEIIKARVFLFNDSFRDEGEALEEKGKIEIPLELEDADYDFIKGKVANDVFKGLTANPTARDAYLAIVSAFEEAKDAEDKKSKKK